ncbi:alpha/beta fold hydrolase [Burkholderia gladioli]|uniref:alpha/beta fold hydrolase n=1 Tax=Burkholderia gladioli TaxID=28095 RepID=UPI00163EB418|nr:alpha/beta fold hydrolase [Burkholderia gladioli]MBJ9677411.1 alpha/beta fold hydrolase [Burkholderia gladioli]MDN7465701.1 alpha/beta fold hydrolase [Burkholderia gladioli]
MTEQFSPWHVTPARTIRRGHFWVPGERVAIGQRTYQRGPMYVEWEAPETVTRKCPIVLMHGGGFQGTEWFDTPDGRPGWAQRLVEAGYAVLVVDRPGHGRSPYHVDTLGAMGPPFSYEGGRQIYFPGDDTRHTQWPFGVDDEHAMDEFIAGYGPLPHDLEASQTMDADRTASLLDRIGPAILITHSASGPDGWLVADRRPHLVKAIAAIEPMGPPFATIPNIGEMRWGPTAAPLRFEPPVREPDTLRRAQPGDFTLPSLAEVPILIVTAEASAFAAASPPTAAFLDACGASTRVLQLADCGVHGNGHGLIYEKNSDAALVPVLDWITHIV